MNWERVKLGEIADFSNGINFGKDAYGKGIKLIGVSNFGNRFSPDYESLDEVKEEVVRKNDFLLSGDMVFVRSNGNKELVGRCMLIDCPTVSVTFSGFCIRARLKDITKHYPTFWTYHFKNISFRRAMSGTAVGANIQNLSQGRLSTYEAIVPNYETQVRIAKVLSAYDNLIENNQKQIKLLEEAALRLYKEWFVDLRFPGYESVEIVDGVPEGWKRTTIGEFLGVRSGYAFKSGWWQDSGYPVVKIKDINNNTVDISSLDHVAPEHTSKIPEFKLDKGDIVIAMTGATIGKIGLVPEVDNLYTNQRVGKVFPNAELLIPTPFVFCFYGQKSILEQIIALSSSSSAQPNISGEQLESFEVIANIDIINKFGKNMQPHFDKINDLYKQNRLLTQARDRLLPKLMNGEIEV